MMFVSARENSVRSMVSDGRASGALTSIEIRSASPVRYGATTSSMSAVSAVGSGCGVGDDAKLENSAEI